MSSTGLDFTSSDTSATGAYLVTGVDLVAIDAAASHAGLQVHKIDFSRVADLPQALASVAGSFDAGAVAPTHCAGLLATLNGATGAGVHGQVVLIDNADTLNHHRREDFTRLLDTFEDAARQGASGGAVFWAFIALDDADFAGGG